MPRIVAETIHLSYVKPLEATRGFKGVENPSKTRLIYQKSEHASDAKAVDAICQQLDVTILSEVERVCLLLQ